MSKSPTKSLTVATMKRRIIAHFDAASDDTRTAGSRWYEDARVLCATLAREHNTTIDVVACVIAAHSMNASWTINKRRAAAQLAGKPVGLGRAIAMAAAAMANPVDPFAHIVGPKINPFAHNVAGDESYVATDRWAQRAAFGTADDTVCDRFIGRKGVRDDMITAYAKAAAARGVSPAVMQAIVWVHVRGAAE